MADKKKEKGAESEEWLDYTIARAIQMRASDIHIEPHREKLIVRFRIDGILHVVDEQKLEYGEKVMSRLKILSQLNIAERRKPQEGHASITLPSERAKQMDMRLSIFPTVFGEVAVMRLLNRSELVFEDITKLGVREEDAERFRAILRRPFGMVLVTGPTGSGKTTMLYTALDLLRSPERNIVTLEDPVEYQIEFVRHTQINPDIGFTFARGLRSILRQDPDVIMIGEIRDHETAEIAVRAALTGRLLFSTLHTNNAIGAITRLGDFNVPRSLIASALRLSVNRRLLRKICTTCRVPAELPQSLLDEAGKTMDITQASFLQGQGCEECSQSGFLGRMGISEMFFVDKEIEMMILEDASFAEIQRVAQEKGMETLRDAAVRAASAGVTTLEEAISATGV